MNLADIDFTHKAVTTVEWMTALGKNIEEHETEREDIDGSGCPSVGKKFCSKDDRS